MTRTYNDYPIVGRDEAIDLEKYTVVIRGRRIIDYERLKQEEPALYARILAEERESNTASEQLQGEGL